MTSKRRGSAVAVAGAAALLAGCGGGDGDQPAGAEPTEPATVDVQVALVDDLPVEVLQSGSGGQCTSVNILDSAFGGPGTPPVEVTVRDADGSIVATTTLPEDGGAFTRGVGCTWGLSFEVDASDFYEVTVRSKAGEDKATGPAEGGAAALEVEL